KWEEVVGYYRVAVALRPETAVAHNNLGCVLHELKRPEEAIIEYRKALEIDSQLAQAHNNLGLALLEQGRFAEARDATRRGLELFPQGHPLHPSLTRRLQWCEQGLVLEKKLGAIRVGQEQAANNAERLVLADLGQQPYKRYYVTSARLFAEAFA